MPKINITTRKDDLGRVINLQIGKTRFAVLYDGDGYPQAIESNAKFSTADILAVLQMVLKMRGEGSSIERAVFVGELTAQTETATDYVLKGTVQAFNIKSENALTEILYDLYEQNGDQTATAKITYSCTNPDISETTLIEKTSSSATAETFIQTLPLLYGDIVNINLYLKVSLAGGLAQSDTFKVFQQATQTQVYLG